MEATSLLRADAFFHLVKPTAVQQKQQCKDPGKGSRHRGGDYGCDGTRPVAIRVDIDM